MAAALFRRGTGLCCIHRELCRIVWRSQTALFSSKPSDRKQPRRTHIKKAKPQPAVDVAKLLEQLFSQRGPGTTPPASKARPAKASSVPTKPPTASSVNVSPLSKTEPAESVFPAASSFHALDARSLSNVTVPTTPGSSPTSTTPVSLGSGAAAIECRTSTETIETKVETAAEPVELKTATALPSSAHGVEKNAEMSSFPASRVEPLIETTIESPVDHVLSRVETPDVRPAAVEDPVAPAVEEVQTKGTDSGVVDLSHKEVPLIETVIESPVESHFHGDTLETRAAAVEGPVEPTVDILDAVAAQKVEAKCTDPGLVDISYTATVEPSLESTVEPSVEDRSTPLESPVEASHSPLETLETRAAAVEGPVEPTVDILDAVAAQKVETKCTDSGLVDTVEPSLESTVEPSVEDSSTPLESPVEASHSPLETLETRPAVVEVDSAKDVTVDVSDVRTSSTDQQTYSAQEEPLIETAIEAHVSDGTIEPTIETEAADHLSHSALILNSQESAPLPLKNESTVEGSAESSSVSVAVEEGENRFEEMTLESVTLHLDEALVASLQTDELLRTKSILDEKAEKKLQELLVQTGIGAEHRAAAAAETGNASEAESEILTEVLSKWDSLSEDLQELEAGSGRLVKDLLCHAPAVLLKTPGTVETPSASDPHLQANVEQTEKKATEAEAAVMLESLTLVKVKTEVGVLETEVLQEMGNALEKEADVLAKEETMDVRTPIDDVAVFEDTTEADILTLDSVSESTDAIAETSVMLEAMFGSEQGLRQPLVDQKLGEQDEATGQEADEESVEQLGNTLRAMSLESVTLAEVEASLGTLENESLSGTVDYLEKEAEMAAGGKRMEVEDMAVSEETEASSLPDADALSEDLQIDELIEELLFSVPGHVAGGTIGQETVRAETVATAAAVTDDFPPALKEVQQQQEEEEEEGAQAEALGDDDGKGTHADLDPVQRLFLEKIKEYNDTRRLNGGLLEAEPDYEKYLSEETAKLQRLYGGGDLSSFPQFTFTEPQMDPDSK